MDAETQKTAVEMIDGAFHDLCGALDGCDALQAVARGHPRNGEIEGTTVRWLAERIYECVTDVRNDLEGAMRMVQNGRLATPAAPGN